MKSWMKKLPDGRLVFYPWGQFMRGYIISSEQEARPLIFQLFIWLNVSMISFVGVYKWKGILAGGVVTAFWVAIYCVWMLLKLRSLQPYES